MLRDIQVQKGESYDQVGMSYIRWKVLRSTLHNSYFRIHRKGGLNCKNPKFLDGWQVVYQVKVWTSSLQISYFKGPVVGQGHQVQQLRAMIK